MGSALRKMGEIYFSLFFQLSNPKNFNTVYKINIDFQKEKKRQTGWEA